MFFHEKAQQWLRGLHTSNKDLIEGSAVAEALCIASMLHQYGQACRARTRQQGFIRGATTKVIVNLPKSSRPGEGSARASPSPRARAVVWQKRMIIEACNTQVRIQRDGLKRPCVSTWNDESCTPPNGDLADCATSSTCLSLEAVERDQRPLI